MALFVCFTPSDLEELSELFQSCPDEALLECLEESGYQPDSEAGKARAQALKDLKRQLDNELAPWRQAKKELKEAKESLLKAQRAEQVLQSQLLPSTREYSVEDLEQQIQDHLDLAAETARQIEVKKAAEAAKAKVQEAEAKVQEAEAKVEAEEA